MTGLTIVLTDMFDVDDLIQIGDNVGVVQRVGMRFTVLKNAMGANVLIPNRSIMNVINFPRGYLRVHVDVTLAKEPTLADRMETVARSLTESVVDQFSGVFRAPSEVVGRFQTSSGKSYLRIKFRIWPGRAGPIEIAYKQELVQALKEIDSNYADWMVAVNSEVERSAPKGS